MHSSTLWNNGPSWLTLPGVKWPAWTPTTTLLVETDQQIRENEPIQMEDPSTLSFSGDTGIHNVDISRYSSLTTLIHVTAYSYVLRFINSLIKRIPNELGH
jgi:hypothetical protein